MKLYFVKTNSLIRLILSYHNLQQQQNKALVKMHFSITQVQDLKNESGQSYTVTNLTHIST